MIDKSKYICTTPFRYTDVFEDAQFLCCPGWLNVDVSEGKTIRENFNSKKSQEIRKSILAYCKKGIEIENLLASDTNFLKSVSEARRSLKENSISINKNKIAANYKVSNSDLINNKYILLQRGKKNYYLLIVN